MKKKKQCQRKWYQLSIKLHRCIELPQVYDRSAPSGAVAGDAAEGTGEAVASVAGCGPCRAIVVGGRPAPGPRDSDRPSVDSCWAQTLLCWAAAPNSIGTPRASKWISTPMTWSSPRHQAPPVPRWRSPVVAVKALSPEFPLGSRPAWFIS